MDATSRPRRSTSGSSAGPQAAACVSVGGRLDRTIWSVVLTMRHAMHLRAEPADPSALLRVMRCLLVVAVVSLVDGVLTIWQAAVLPGFADWNPVVQAFISAGWPGGIAVLKIATLGFAAAVFLRYYTRPSTQWAGRIAVVAYLWVSVHWVLYFSGLAS